MSPVISKIDVRPDENGLDTLRVNRSDSALNVAIYASSGRVEWKLTPLPNDAAPVVTPYVSLTVSVGLVTIYRPVWTEMRPYLSYCIC